MNYRINSVAMNQAREVLTLLRAYSEAQYSLAEMGVSAQTWDDGDRMAIGNSSLMPIRISGKLYKVSEHAGSCVGALAPFMAQSASQSGLRDPRAVGIQGLELILSLLSAGKSAAISARSVPDDMLMVYGSGVAEKIFPGLAVYVPLLALDVDGFDWDDLAHNYAYLVPA